MLLSSDNSVRPSDWSRDGKNLLYTQNQSEESRRHLGSRLDASGKPGPPVPFLKTAFNESQGQFSPDGRWVAYISNELGQDEGYVRPFPSGGGATKISSNIGQEPRWRSDGEELYYVVLGRPATLMAVPVKSLPGRPLELSHSPSAGGQRFLVNVLPNAALPALNVITNWEHAAAAK